MVQGEPVRSGQICKARLLDFIPFEVVSVDLIQVGPAEIHTAKGPHQELQPQEDSQVPVCLTDPQSCFSVFHYSLIF